MDAQVTEDMVRAAHHMLPGISNRIRVRHAIEAAIAAMPDPSRVDIPVTARVLVHIDPDHMREQISDGIERWATGQRYDSDGRMLVAILDAVTLTNEPHVTPDGLEGPGVTDPTGQTGVTVTQPRVYAGVAEIATRLNAARSTVAGWVKNADTNGMPAPLATLAAGPVYDLDAVAAWHEAWKARA